MATREEYEFIARFKTEALNAARDAEEALKGMGGAAKDAAEDASGAAKSLKDVAQATAAVVGSVLLIKEVLQGVSAGLSAFADFEVRMVGVAKVTSLTARELETLGTSFELMAADMGLAVEQFTETAAVAGQLGVDGVKDIATFTKAVVELGGASNLVGEEGATKLARMLKITGESVSTAGTLASVLVELGNNVAATEREIAQVASEIARSTASFGTSTTFASGLGAAMAELGLRAETAGTAVGRIFAEISLAAAKGGDDAKQFADAMGLTVDGFKELVDSSPTKAFERFLQQLNAMGSTDALLVLDGLKLANAETLKTLTPLISNYERFTEVMRLASDEAANPSALQTEALAAQQTLAREYAGLMELVNAAIRDVGEAWAPVARALVNGLSTVLQAFNGLDSTLREVVIIMTTLAPVAVAAVAAFKVLVPLVIALAPAQLRLAATGGALAASMAGMGTSATVAAAALSTLGAVARVALGPLGLLIATGTALYFMLDDNEDAADNLGAVLREAESAMDAYAAATARATEEQAGLRGGITAATQELVAQSRSQLQLVADQLERTVTVGLKAEFDGGDADSLLGQLSHTLEELEERAEFDLPIQEELSNAVDLLAGLKEGTLTFDQFRDRFAKMTSVGNEALELVLQYRNTFAVAGDTLAGQEQLRSMVEYAREVGLFGDELEHIQRMLDRNDTNAALLGIDDLARSMEGATEVAEILRDLLPETFVAALDEMADAEVQLASIWAALQGNHELAMLILQTGNPFAVMEQGAKDAEDAIEALVKDVQEALGLSKEYLELDKESVTFARSFEGAQDGATAAAKLLREFEGFRSTPYFDVNALRAGFGSDTITLSDGTVKAVAKGMRVSVEDANRDLTRRIGEFQQGIIREIGPAIFNSFTPAQQAALTSVAYNYGSIGRGGANIADVVRTGDTERIAQAIASLAGHNGGINRNRRLTEATIFAEGVGVESVALRSENAARREAADAERDATRAFKERVRAEREAAEARIEFLRTKDEALQQAEFEISLIGKSVSEQARLRAEYELTNQARREGINIDTEQAASGRTYREEIAATAQALGELARQEQFRANAVEHARQQQEFFNDTHEDFRQGVLDAIVEGKSLSDVLGGLAKAFARASLEAALFGGGPLGSGGGGFLSGITNTIFKGLGGLFGVTTPNAKGNVVYQSAIIPMAKGGRALIGEAGPEAIIPLDRGRDGTLGVRAIGDGGYGNGMVVNYAPVFNIATNGQVSGQDENAPGAQERLLKTLDVEVRAKVLEVLQREMNNGGLFNPAVKPYG